MSTEQLPLFGRQQPRGPCPGGRATPVLRGEDDYRNWLLLLQTSLAAVVPLRVLEMRRQGKYWTPELLAARGRKMGHYVGLLGASLQFPGKKHQPKWDWDYKPTYSPDAKLQKQAIFTPEESAQSVFNMLSEGIACEVMLRGGARHFGVTFDGNGHAAAIDKE